MTSGGASLSKLNSCGTVSEYTTLTGGGVKSRGGSASALDDSISVAMMGSGSLCTCAPGECS